MVPKRYRILEPIGQGGMATVYRAHDEQLGRDVALKVFDRGLSSPEDLQRQQGEVRHLAGFAHPSLVTLFDVILDDDGRNVLVLEYVPGDNLRTRLADGPLPPTTVAAIGRSVADALAHIHSRQVIHRDVSPGNILLPTNAASDASTAKLTDLGIARVVDAGRITATGTLIGTAAYLSPEQVQGAQVSSASDIYSLGLVLLECLTGQRAFDGPAIESAMARLGRDPEIPAQVPESWRSLITSMTAREPADRPSAEEVSNALVEISTADVPATAQYTMPHAAYTDHTRVLQQPPADRSRWARDRRGVLLTVAVGLALIALALVVALPGGKSGAKPAPSYPTIPGKLGTDLKHLEQGVAP